jgi:hypothetical protein
MRQKTLFFYFQGGHMETTERYFYERFIHERVFLCEIFCLIVWVRPYFKFVMKVAFWQKMTVFGKMQHTEPKISQEPQQE